MMFRHGRPALSLSVRIGVLLFAGVMCAGVGLYLLLVNLTRQRLGAELDVRVRSTTQLLATRLGTPLLLEDHDGIETELRRALRVQGIIGVAVYDVRGHEFERMVGDPRRWPSAIPGPWESADSSGRRAHLSRLRAREALAPIVRESALPGAEWEAGEVFGIETPDHPGAALGWVRTVYATDAVDDAVGAAARLGFVVLLGALALWSVPLFGLLRFITQPLREASDLARSIAHGELERRIPVRSPDELGTLADSLNTMAAALTQSREQTRVEAETMRQATRAVVAIARGAREAGEVDAVFEVVAAQLRGLTGSQGAALALPDEGGMVSRLRRFDPPAPWGDLVEGQDLDAGLLRRLEGGPLVLEPTPDGTALSRALERGGYRRVLLVPLGERGERGSILLASDRDTAFPPAQIEVVVGLASHLASALHAATLHARLESAVHELDRTRERLEHSERMRVAGEMASGVAHDFNNVLGAILGRAQLLRRQAEGGGLTAEQLVPALRVIEQAAMDGGDTVQRLRQFAPGGQPPETELVDLDEAMRGAAEFTRPRWETEARATGRPIDLRIDSAPGGLVRGRGSELREVFTNLILNAVDAMPSGGTLRLSTSSRGAQVVATVEDDGIGMTAAIRRRIFDPFFTTKGARGTGLGLSVVYGIVQGVGGTIHVDSSPGRGTRVVLELPRSEASVTAEAPPPPVAVACEPLRVMVVDDESAVRELLREILVSLGHEAGAFSSGAEALEGFQAGRWDLVFTDLGMPGMSGWELTRAIRTRDPEITIAIITGWGAEVSPQAVSGAGADAVVSKPFTIEDIEGLTRLVRERRDRAA